ncbi:MAG: hypothetical protein GY832_31325 [Chloroflexi bacterium]|nr:hypothetical protein [Chloroflexota bacterium]
MPKQRVRILLLVFSVLLLACNATELSPTVLSDESAVETRVAQDVAATVAALPTDTVPAAQPTFTPKAPSTDTPLPPSPTDAPTKVPPTPVPISDAYVVKEERLIGTYTVQLWRNTADDAWGYDNIVTISADDQILAQIEMVWGFGALTGDDITGEGNPDVIIETFTGGAHCCFSTIVYDLGSTLTQVLKTRESNCGGGFEDLDGDAILEFVTCDDLFAYVYCPYAASPTVQAVLQYDPAQGYVPVSSSFPHLYTEAIAQHTEMARNAVPEELGEWDQTTKCAVLPLILDYLYSGQTDQAWTKLNELYHHSDTLLFWAEVMQAASASSLYTTVGSSPDVPLPSYYMLQMLTNCGPDWRYVGLLEEGAPDCDPDTLRRDIYWLEPRLREIDLVKQGERLELVPEGCTTNCRLDVIRYSDEARVGSIRLDTSMGFPGEVYRANGVESARWRLRGDLTWEQVLH